MQDVALSEISRVEYIETDDQLLGSLRRYKMLRTYPTASDRGQVALHAAMLRLEARGLVAQAGRDGAAVRWRSIV